MMLAPQQSALKQLSTTVERSFDAADFNRIVNDQSVRPHVGFADAGPLDIAPLLEDHGNVYLAADGGTILFIHDCEPGIYEVHTNFLENHRGKHAIECSRNAYRWMFTHTDCGLILTRVPANNRPAAMAARVVGFKHQFTRKQVWATENGNIDLRFYTMDYETWLSSAAPELMATGREFHAQLERDRKRLGVEEAGHLDDDYHDLRAGACLEMIYGGQPEKGVILYNRWARFAGYAPIALIARAPLVIDIGDAVLQVQDQSFKVVKIRCRPQPS